MYHHSESPEVIAATRAEWERTVAAHRALLEAERAPIPPDIASESRLGRLSGMLQRLLRPQSRINQPSNI